jgi:tape measure domain-containing protein
MAESVARVKVQATADLKGLDDAAKALKDLQRAIAPTDAALSKARLEIIQFGYANKQTEKLIAAQINALKTLRTEAQVGGQLYENLGKDIDGLKNKLNGTSAATEKAASSFEQLGRAATNIQNSLQKQGQSFSAFKRQAGDTGKAVGELAAAFNIKFDNASKNIQDAARQLEALKKNASNIGNLFQGPQKGGGLFEIPRKGLADIQAFSQLVTRLKEQTETATGRVARLSEGLFAAGVAGKGISATVASLGGVAGAAENVAKFAANLSASFAQMGAGAPQWAGGMKAALNQISLLLNQPANGVANWVSSLNNAQAKLTALNVPLEAFNNALGAIGPEGAAVAGVLAVSFAGLQDAITRAFRAGDKEASEALQSITDETQRLINKLAQLSEAFRGAASMNELQALRAGGAARFNETPAGTDASRRAANTIASAEARIKAESMAQAEVLEAARQRYRGTTESVDALSERLAYLQQAMKYVDQSTAEGKAEFAAFSNEANKVKGQIDQLSNSYRTVADAIRDAARAQGEYANQSTVNNYLNRAATRQQEELVAAAREALSRPQVPLLPAGDTSKPAIRGGARILSNFEVAGTSEQIGAAMSSQTEAMTRALNAADKEVDDLKKSFQELIAPVEKVAKSEFFSPNSINALKARREQIDRERNAVDMLGDDYQRLSRELAKVDKQLERTQPGGLRGKIGYIGQGIGAAASAGIFGGPEGAIGGLLGGGIGAIAGGPAGFAAGSFIGSSAGAYAGMARQQLGQFTTYAADISKLEIALKGVTKTQEEYQRALAASASVTRDFNVPQLEATKGITQLSAAVIGAGGKVADAEVVFRNVTAAIKASGGSAEDVQGALTALGQIFSKGKVSAEELQGQLGERLPGAVTMFAKATGRTLPQLQKDLEQGVVGLADLMKFITSDQGLGQFEQRAKNVAKSSADAGARLTATFNDTKRAIGDALLPLGAEIQDSLGRALKDATPALVEFAKGAAALIKLLVDNAGLIGGVLKTLLGFGAVAGAAVGVTQLAGAISSVTLAVKSLGGVMGVTTLAARTLGLSIAAIPGIGWIAAGVTALGLLTVELYNNNTAFRTWANNLARVISSDFKNAWDQAVSITSTATKDIGDLLNGLSGIASSVGSAISSRFENAFGGLLKQVRDFWNGLPGPIREAMSRGAGAAVGGLVSPGNPFAGYVGGVAIRAAQMGPNAQDSGMFGRYGVAGGKTDNLSSGGLTDWKIEQQQKEDAEKRAADKARKEAERLAAEQQRLDEAVAKAEIQLAQTVFNNQIELIKKRYDYEQERIQAQRDIWAGTFEGLRSESARAANELVDRLEQIRQRTRSATLGVVVAEQTAAFNARMEAVTGQGLSGGGVPISSTGIVARTGNTGDSTGAHLDLRWGDGRPITKADADKYFLVNGRAPSSFGVTSPYGPRSLFGRSFHRGIDFGTPAGSAITLKGGATFGRNLGNTGAGGYAIEVMTPEGTMRALHLMANSAVRSAPAGVAAQIRRNVTAGGKAAGASAEVQQANAMLGLEAAQSNVMLRNEGVLYVQQRTQGLRDEAKALENSNALLQKRMELEYAGLRPELIDAQMKIAEIEQQRAEKLAQINENIQQNQYDPEAVAAFRLEIEETNAAYDRQIAAINALAQAQTAAGVALKSRIGQLRQELNQLAGLENLIVNMSGTIESSISTAISGAVTNMVTGAGSIKQVLADMFRSVGEAFIKMAADIIAKQLIMVALNQLLGLFGGGGFSFSGAGPVSGASVFGGGQAAFNPAAFTGGFSFANGGVMSNVGPLPLKRYAAGGVANSPQMAVFGERGPEAYVPLPDGRNIPVKMKQRNEALNRYRPMGPMGTVAGGEEAGVSGSMGGSAVGGAIDVRYTVERINNVEYVTAEQFQQGMRQAAAQGAAQGEQRTLRRLQQSPSARRRTGV